MRATEYQGIIGDVVECMEDGEVRRSGKFGSYHDHRAAARFRARYRLLYALGKARPELRDALIECAGPIRWRQPGETASVDMLGEASRRSRPPSAAHSLSAKMMGKVMSRIARHVSETLRRKPPCSLYGGQVADVSARLRILRDIASVVPESRELIIPVVEPRIPDRKVAS